MTLEIESNRPFNPLFEAPPPSDESRRALTQKYRYLASGGQAFVFISEDGKYVLKFFKQRHFREPTHLNYIPFIKRYRDLKFSKRQKRVNQEYNSYKIGFKELPQDTAILYIHLNPTTHFHQTVTLIDRLNIEHKIDLDQIHFILQRKAQLVPHTISSQMHSHDLVGAKETISQIVDLIVRRCQLGYGDKDPNIATNCGILEGRAIKIDVGRLYHDPRMKHPLFFKPELLHLTRPFRQWLQKNHPQLVSHLDAEIERILLHG